jgi:hypothetical protein
MANGDSADILRRVKLTIPNRWFAFVAPLRDAVLGGISDGAAFCFNLIVYAASQARISTSTGPFLDLISFDFLGPNLPRNGLSDHAFVAKIKATILQERVTRQGMINAITALTGNPPVIFEPWNTNDAGGYSGSIGVVGSNPTNQLCITSLLLGMGGVGGTISLVGNIAYGKAGGWGSMNLPNQVFITVTRGAGSGVPNVAGYGNSIGGYGAGSIEYAGPSVEQSGITDQDIYDVINNTKPTGTRAWVQII